MDPKFSDTSASGSTNSVTNELNKLYDKDGNYMLFKRKLSGYTNSQLNENFDDSNEMIINSNMNDKTDSARISNNTMELMMEHDNYFRSDTDANFKIPDKVYNTFSDGIRSIDFVIVYDTKLSKAEKQHNGEKSEPEITEQHSKEQAKDKVRANFLNNLRNAGLELEEEVVTTDKIHIHFIKLHIPWGVLTKYAEELNFRVPIKIYQNDDEMDFTESVLRRFKIEKILLSDEQTNRQMEFFTCLFRRSHIHKYIPSTTYPAFISNTQRQSAIHEILQIAHFGEVSKGEVGINRLLKDGYFTDAFPLHDGPYEDKEEDLAKIPTNPSNPRKELYSTWARYSKWYKYQPIDHIRDYFGEKISLYFAWLGAYTHWLLVPSIVGVLVFLISLGLVDSDIPANEVCTLGNNITMCPTCDDPCPYWNLSDSCFQTRLSVVFDNPYTVFFAIFMTLWAFSFMEYWKRKNVSLAYRWDTLDFEEEEERPRTEFVIKSEMTRLNPITEEIEPVFPKSTKYLRMVAAFTTILFMISIVIIFIFAIIIYRILLNISIFKYNSLRNYSSLISSSSSAMLNLIVILILGRFYEKLAYTLTEWEMHKTQTEFDNHLTFKVFIFQFVNFYASLFYIAFVKGKFVGYPGNYTTYFGLRAEDCDPGGCLVELTQQLAIVMIGKQMINNVQEIVLPKVQVLWHRFSSGMNNLKRDTAKTQIEKDYELIPHEGLFEEYLEMVLQFGFITNFIVSFTLAPLFALLNNWIEIRLDAKKFVCGTRRPVAQRAGNIGVWFDIIAVLIHIAAIGNAFLIAFTSQFLPKLLYQYKYNWNLNGFTEFSLATAPNGTLSQPCRYFAYRNDTGQYTEFYWELLAIRFGFVILFEHVLFGISKLIDFSVPDVPEALSVKIRRERYLAKKAFQETL